MKKQKQEVSSEWKVALPTFWVSLPSWKRTLESSTFSCKHFVFLMFEHVTNSNCSRKYEQLMGTIDVESTKYTFFFCVWHYRIIQFSYETLRCPSIKLQFKTFNTLTHTQTSTHILKNFEHIEQNPCWVVLYYCSYQLILQYFDCSLILTDRCIL